MQIEIAYPIKVRERYLAPDARLAGVEIGTFGGVRTDHDQRVAARDLRISGAIEQLMPSVRPDGHGSARDGDLLFAVQLGVATHVHFASARLVRFVREPPPVRREYRVDIAVVASAACH